MASEREGLLNQRVRAVIENDWGQLLRNRVAILSTIGPPVFLVFVALTALFLAKWLEIDITGVDPSSLGSEDRGLLSAVKEAQNLQQNLRAALLTSFLVLFQMIPMVVPLSIASHSIVSEKQNRSLEALLATPIRTEELLLAKAISAAVPGVLATWYGFGLFAIGARFAVSDAVYNRLIVGPTWLLSIVLTTPLLTLLTVGMSIIVSSRVRDPESAQQVGSLVILPLIGLLIVQTIGVANLNMWLVLATAGLVGILDVFVLWAAVRLFRREEIVTTWR